MTYLTPPMIAKRLAVNIAKVLRWIATGELRAIDVSHHPDTGNPRWRISPDWLAAFEEERSNNRAAPSTQTPRQVRRAGRRYFSSPDTPFGDKCH